MTLDRLSGHAGRLFGTLMFLALVPSGATLIYRLITRERGSDTVPLITFMFDIAFSAAVAVIQLTDLGLMTLFLTVGRRKGLVMSCTFLFGGLLVNMLFVGVSMLFCDKSNGLPALYSLAEGLLFMVSALALSVSSGNSHK